MKDTRRRESMPSDTESSDDDGGSSTPKPWILQSDGESERADEASTIRLDPQSDSEDGSETPPRRTVGSINSSLIANIGYRDGSLIDSLVNPTEFEEWQGSGAPDPDTQPSQVPDTSVALQQGSMVDGLLWNSEDPGPANLTSNHDSEATKATKDRAGKAQTKGLPDESHDISFLIRYHLGYKVPGYGAQEAVETSGVVAEESHQSIRKRTWPEESPSFSLTRSFTHPLSESQQRVINRDIPSSKGPPDHKRSKRGE